MAASGRRRHHHQFFNNSEDDNVFSAAVCEAANKRLLQDMFPSHKQAEVVECLLRLRPIGLKLQNTSSLLESIETNLLIKRRKNYNSHKQVGMADQNPVVQPNINTITNAAGKFKASKFPATLIRIGSWQKEARNEEDLLAKCYFAKRKLVWEVLEYGLKSKIEIAWSHIVGIRAVSSDQDNTPGFLEVELNQKPAFYREIDPRPRKHTTWSVADDFTNGQALLYRQHLVIFPPGLLDKYLEKLVQCENRFLELIERPFPTLNTLHFKDPSFLNHDFVEFPIECNGNDHESNNTITCNSLQIPNSISSVANYLNLSQQQIQTCQEQQYHQLLHGIYKDTTSPTSVMDFSSLSQYKTQEMKNINEEISGTDQIQGLPQTIDSQNFMTASNGVDHNNHQVLIALERQMMSDNIHQVELISNEQEYYHPKVNWVYSLLGFIGGGGDEEPHALKQS